MEIIKIKTKDQLIDSYLLRLEVFVGEQHVPLADEIDFKEKSMDVYAAYADLRLVATCRVERHGTSAHLGRFCVAKSERRKGIGRKMIACIERELKDAGTKCLELAAQDTALPFYLSLGYVIDSGPFIDGTLPHHHVSKIL